MEVKENGTLIDVCIRALELGQIDFQVLGELCRGVRHWRRTRRVDFTKLVDSEIPSFLCYIQ